MQNKTIFISLLLAPIPLLTILTGLFIFGNMYSGKGGITLDQIPHVLLLTLAIWVIYCILTIPISYPISILLQRKNCLNIWTALLGSIVVGWLVRLIFQLLFIQSFFIFDFESVAIFSTMTLFSGLCYWLFIKLFQKKNT